MGWRHHPLSYSGDACIPSNATIWVCIVCLRISDRICEQIKTVTSQRESCSAFTGSYIQQLNLICGERKGHTLLTFNYRSFFIGFRASGTRRRGVRCWKNWFCNLRWWFADLFLMHANIIAKGGRLYVGRSGRLWCGGRTKIRDKKKRAHTDTPRHTTWHRETNASRGWVLFHKLKRFSHQASEFSSMRG